MSFGSVDTGLVCKTRVRLGAAVHTYIPVIYIQCVVPGSTRVNADNVRVRCVALHDSCLGQQLAEPPGHAEV